MRKISKKRLRGAVLKKNKSITSQPEDREEYNKLMDEDLSGAIKNNDWNVYSMQGEDYSKEDQAKYKRSYLLKDAQKRFEEGQNYEKVSKNLRDKTIPDKEIDPDRAIANRIKLREEEFD